MIKPLPLEADWVVWPKMLVLVAEQLMDTVLFTVAAYTSLGSIFVRPFTVLICTLTGLRPLSWMVASLPLPPLTIAAPPTPAAPPTTAQASSSAVTLTHVRWKKPCFFGAGVISGWGRDAGA